jgi:hypothetical protein
MMSILVRIRGLSSMKKWPTKLAIGLLLFGASTAVAEPGTSAELRTYQRDDGQTYFALCIVPPPDTAPANQPRDVVILFDTSASQAGMYRETGLAAVEACLAKLGPQDRVQVVAADLDARPITTQFVSADSNELRTAVTSLRDEPLRVQQAAPFCMSAMD